MNHPGSKLRADTLLAARKYGWLNCIAPFELYQQIKIRSFGSDSFEYLEQACRLNLINNSKKSEASDSDTTPSGSEGDDDFVQLLDENLNFDEEPEVNRGTVSRKKATKYSKWNPFPNAEENCNAFRRNRVQIGEALMSHFDKKVFGSRLSSSTTLEWSRRLNKTAGITRMRRHGKASEDGTHSRTAVIELSVKVVDRMDRLYSTLAHELCHAAQWTIDLDDNPKHGQSFKKWTKKCSRFDSELSIERCHSYAINYKFNYQCSSCMHIYGRHSKSVNLDTQRCGKCRGTLTLQ